MGKTNPITNFFFKKKDANSEAESSLPSSNVDDQISLPIPIIDPPNVENPTQKTQITEINEVEVNSLERDPGKRKRIYDYHPNQRDKIRRFYIKEGPFQPILDSYPRTEISTKSRSFVKQWFSLHPSWLEYSPTLDAAFCLPCYLFSPPSGNAGNMGFIVNGFRRWNKATGETGALSNHVGKDPNSCHKVAQKLCEDLMNQPQHIERSFEDFTSGEVASNRLRVECSIQAAQYLATHGIAFRGHDERPNSLNRGNFLDLIAFMGRCNEKIAEVVLSKAPQNAIYTSPTIQKEILHVIATKVKKEILEEIGDAKFSIIVDEARDEAKREQMSIVLRFVNNEGFVIERFFGLVHVSDTTALTLKQEICNVLSNHNLLIQNIRGQGYDGASNMRGEWKGLKALILRECPYAYYVHCVAHRLQLALVTASREVQPIFKFFEKLNYIVIAVTSSCKRHDQLKKEQAQKLKRLIDIDELETGTGQNQIGTIQRPGDTRWSSHLRSTSSLIRMFSSACEVLLYIGEEGATLQDRGVGKGAHKKLTSFDFVFILHVVNEILLITDVLCQAFQSKSQDLVNAIRLLSSTHALLKNLRNERFDALLVTVKSFCEEHLIDVPDMSARYVPRNGKARHHPDNIQVEHYYRVDILHAAIDRQVEELNDRFSDNSMDLITLSMTLDPREHESFEVDGICQLVDQFYPEDFSDQEKTQLKMQLSHYKHSVIIGTPEFKTLRSMPDLCQWMVKTRRSTTYDLVFRLIKLVLTLPVSTATAERSFSAMKIIKTRLRNKMENEFLSDSSLIYIEKEISLKLGLESIVTDFRDLHNRRVPF